MKKFIEPNVTVFELVGGSNICDISSSRDGVIGVGGNNINNTATDDMEGAPVRLDIFNYGGLQ